MQFCEKKHIKKVHGIKDVTDHIDKKSGVKTFFVDVTSENDDGVIERREEFFIEKHWEMCEKRGYYYGGKDNG